MLERLHWERDGADWPNRDASAFVTAAGLRWHVQRLGAGPVVLLLHGTGAATHSWRDLAPLLAADHTVIAPDLPGHGFTSGAAPARLSLPGMARAVDGMLAELGVRPALAVGHSAGAAVLVRMCLDGTIAPRALVSLNGALLPFGGVPGRVFSPLARLLSRSTLVPRLFAARARERAAVERLIRSTGSTLDARGIALYQRIVGNPGHAAAALAMMANWDLGALSRELPRLRVPLTLVVGERDRTVSPTEAARVARLLPSARLVRLPGLGHLAHEEDPQQIARIVRDAGT